jgi:hypothetical protein
MKDEGSRMKAEGGGRKAEGHAANPSIIFDPSFRILYPLSLILIFAALLIGWRRLAGALSQPLAPAAMVLAAASVAGLAALARSGRPTAAWNLLLSAAVLLLGLALCVRGTAGAGVAAFWGVVAGEEGWAWGRLLLPTRRRGGRSRFSWRKAAKLGLFPLSRGDKTRRLRVDGADGGMGDGGLGIRAPLSPHEDEDALPAENVLQRLTLSQEADGGQRLSGWLRLRLAAGQRSGVVHVAFCPPFCRTPELSLEQLRGPPARIRTAQLLPHGVRLELKLSTAAAAGGSVLLRFAAWTAGGAQS